MKQTCHGFARRALLDRIRFVGAVLACFALTGSGWGQDSDADEWRIWFRLGTVTFDTDAAAVVTLTPVFGSDGAVTDVRYTTDEIALTYQDPGDPEKTVVALRRSADGDTATGTMTLEGEKVPFRMTRLESEPGKGERWSAIANMGVLRFVEEIGGAYSASIEMTGLDFGDLTVSDVTYTLGEISFTLEAAGMPMGTMIFEAERDADGQRARGALSNPALAEWRLEIELRLDENAKRAGEMYEILLPALEYTTTDRLASYLGDKAEPGGRSAEAVESAWRQVTALLAEADKTDADAQYGHLLQHFVRPEAKEEQQEENTDDELPDKRPNPQEVLAPVEL